MDLLVFGVVLIVITVLCIPYTGSPAATSEYSIIAPATSTSTFVAEDLPYCETALCKRVKCFTYYQEVLGLWHS